MYGAIGAIGAQMMEHTQCVAQKYSNLIQNIAILWIQIIFLSMYQFLQSPQYEL